MDYTEINNKVKDKSIFRNERGMIFGLNLFLEHNTTDVSQAIYTFKRRDYKGYPSLYKLYMLTDDPLEYRFANTYFEDYKHWEDIYNHYLLKDEINGWRKELELKVRSEALNRIRIDAKSNKENSFQANKYLLDKGWKKEDLGPTRGRPSKEDIQKEANKIFTQERQLKEDFERIMN